MQPHRSYLLCATPRSGSTLLCEALHNTGGAGRPAEYFETLQHSGLPRQPKEYFQDLTELDMSIIEHLGEYSTAEHTRLQEILRDSATYADYLNYVFREGTTPNGVFGAKMMWGYFDDFLTHARQLPGNFLLTTHDLLTSVFPDLHYLYITRRDTIRQAVSLWKAVQTGAWKLGAVENTNQPERELVFNFTMIDHLVHQLSAHDTAWQRYFAENNIHPFTIVYEDLTEDYEEIARDILRYLNIPIPEQSMFAQPTLQRQADALSESWVQRYHAITRKSREAWHPQGSATTMIRRSGS